MSPKNCAPTTKVSIEHLVPESPTSEQDHGPLFSRWTCHCPCSLFRSDSNQSTQHLVDRRPHHRVRALSHPRLVAAGVEIASCLIVFLAASVVVPLARVATLVLTTAVTDKLAASTPPPAAVTRIVLASVAAVGQVFAQWLMPRGRSTTKDPREIT